MATDLKKVTPKKAPCSLYLPKSIDLKIHELARQERRSFTRQVEVMLEEALKSWKPGQTVGSET